MRVLLIGAVLGALLGGCSFVMLGQIEWLALREQVVLSVIIGLSFSGLIWSFGLVRWIATRMDQRAARADDEVYADFGEMPVDAVDPLSDAEVGYGEAEVRYDEETGIVDVESIGLSRDPGPGPVPHQGDLDGMQLPQPPPEEFEDDNTTQLISRAELRALARALMEGGPAVPAPTLEPGQVEELIEQAFYATEAGRFDEAVEIYTNVIEGAEDPRAYLGRGRIHLDHSEYNRAMSDFKVAEEMMPGRPEPLVAMGDLFFGRKDYKQSIGYLTMALSQQPDHAMALTRRGMSQYYLKDYEAALQDLQRASELDPDIPLLSSYLARAERRVRGIPTSVISDRRRR